MKNVTGTIALGLALSTFSVQGFAGNLPSNAPGVNLNGNCTNLFIDEYSHLQLTFNFAWHELKNIQSSADAGLAPAKAIRNFRVIHKQAKQIRQSIAGFQKKYGGVVCNVSSNSADRGSDEKVEVNVDFSMANLDAQAKYLEESAMKNAEQRRVIKTKQGE